MHVSCRMHVSCTHNFQHLTYRFTQRDVTGYLQIHTSSRICIYAMDLASTCEYGNLVMHALLLDKFLLLNSLKS